MKRYIPIVFVVAVVTLIVSLVSGGSGKAHKAAQTAPGPYGSGLSAAPARPATGSALDLRTTRLGKVLVDAKGRTLYLFEADKPNVSRLSAAGQAIWPPFTSQGKPQAHGGVLAAKIGTTTGSGKKLVTYNGHPLYYYVGDQKAGDTTGQGLNQFGAEWYVLGANGDKIDNG